MEKFLNRLERKFGRYAIRNFMYYVIGARIIGVVLGLISPYIYYDYLYLDFSKIMQGQIWRLITFILEPESLSGTEIVFLAIELYFYYSIGTHLENAWGAFRFNVYYLSGIFFQIIAALIMYLVTKDPVSGYYFGLSYINESIFLAFCAMYPNLQLLLALVIPIKAKYLAYVAGAMIAFQIFQSIMGGYWYMAIAIIVALANFVIFYFTTRNMRRIDPRVIKRKVEYKRAVSQPKNITRHKCAICGRTEQDDPTLEFRFCSKCNGNYEYCQDHLFTHTHVE